MLARGKRGEPPAVVPQVGGRPALRGVLFDAGLTLLRSATSTSQMAALVLARRGLSIDARVVDQAMVAAEARIEDLWQGGDWFASEAGVRELFVSSYSVGLKSIEQLRRDASVCEAIAAEMYDEYSRASHWELYPDVLPAVRALAAAGVVMGVVSDWGHGLEGLLLELGLGAYLQLLVVSARFGVTKPDPTVFAMALDRLGVSAVEAIYVGDTYVKDVLGSRAAGIIPVLLDREGRAPSLDCPTIRSLAELPRLVGIGPRQVPADQSGG